MRNSSLPDLDEYHENDFIVTIRRPLTQVEFHKIEMLLQTNLGRYKSYANVYTFNVPHVIIKAVLTYLQKIQAPHELECSFDWSPHGNDI